MTVVIIPDVDCVSGSYTDSVGIDNIRKDVASYISERDGGIACDYKDVFLCGGASDGIKVLPQCQGFMQDKIIASHTCFGGHMDVNC